MLNSFGRSRPSLKVLRKPSFATTINVDNVALKMRSAYDRLKEGPDELYFSSFQSIPGIQNLLTRDILGAMDLERVWLKVVSDTQKPANFKQFLAINDEMSNLFGRELSPATSGSVSDYVWDPDFSVADKFRGDTVIHIKQYFSSVATKAVSPRNNKHEDATSSGNYKNELVSAKKMLENSEKLISFGSFAQWTDVTDVLEEGNLDLQTLNQLWLEAVEYKYMKQARHSRSDDASQKKKVIALSADMKRDIESKSLYYSTDRSLMIDLDTFLRLNYRLDEVVDDIMSHPARQTEKHLEKFYRQEFQRITNRDSLMSYDQLLHWNVVQEMLTNKAITESDLQRVWDILPHQFLPVDGPVRIFAPQSRSDVPGITEDSFIALNHSLQYNLRKELDKD